MEADDRLSVPSPGGTCLLDKTIFFFLDKTIFFFLDNFFFFRWQILNQSNITNNNHLNPLTTRVLHMNAFIEVLACVN